MREASRWGLAALFNPDLSVHAAPAIWRAAAASQLVSLVAAPPDFEGAARIPDTRFTAQLVAGDKRHVVLDRGGVRHRFLVPAAKPDEPLVILMPPLGDALRAAACDAARRMFAGLGHADAVAVMRA